MVATTAGWVKRGVVSKAGPCCRKSVAEIDGLPVDRTDLEETKGKQWALASLAEMVGYTVRKTDLVILPEIDRVDSLLAEVCAGHAVAHPELLRIYTLFYWLRRDLMNHILNESDSLFPYIVRMERAVSNNEELPKPFFHSVRQSIRLLMVEHDTIETLLRNVAAATSGFEVPHDACPSFRRLYSGLAVLSANLRDLIQLENYLLFPRAVEVESRYRLGSLGTQ
jgi:regulator of cell morphogenesis and NO signaling